MKKLWCAILLTGAIFTEANAAGLYCRQINGQSGEIEINFITNAEKVETQVIQMLEAEKVNYTGILKNLNFGKTVYELINTSSSGPATLTITSVSNHGGRCGRCSPNPIKATYAKLETAANEWTYECFTNF